ncbi:MAG: glucosaminidase domain-containing protein [Bacteroidales bacterium]|nr:glucosaminidase domain-containing protein [Bacteroidales bacterium]
MKFRYLLVFLLLAASCSTQKRSVIPRQTENSKQYINEYKDLAIQEMNRTGIPASITLAQGILESDYGNSRLAREGNNHFGIKCHSTWNGKRIFHDDDRRNECFRKYPNVYDSFKDHSHFLTTSSRYDFLFDYRRTDYEKWARGLKRAGYATSPTYASRLIELIERYELHRFDRMNAPQITPEYTGGGSSLGNVDNYSISAGKHRIRTRNRIDYIVVSEGDTFKKLNKELDMLPWELKKYNEWSDTAALRPGQILYLQPKRKKAARGYNHHKVEEGETMHSISQRYGVKLEELYEKNRMEEGEEPEPGDKIWLRQTKPDN